MLAIFHCGLYKYLLELMQNDINMIYGPIAYDHTTMNTPVLV